MIVDLCAGAGGWDVALQHLGHDSVGIETDHAACRTAIAAGHHRVRADMTAYPPEVFAGAAGLVASPPCTDFSKAGRRKGLDGKTGQLVWEPVRWVTTIRPGWVCFEQVPEVLPIWKMEADKLRTIGYRTWTGILDAADYGVPQNRKRAILLASLHHQPTTPQPSHCQGGRDAHHTLLGVQPALHGWVSMAEALGWDETWELEQIRGAGMTERHGERPTRRATEPAFTVTGSLSGNARGRWRLHTNRGQDENGNSQIVNTERPGPSVTGKAGGQWYWALQPGAPKNQKRPVGKPAPTIALGHDMTVAGDQRIAQPGHKGRTPGEPNFKSQMEGAVKVTVPELGVLQSFPGDYPWTGTKTQQATQVGNAIPPLLALACIAEAAGIALKVAA